MSASLNKIKINVGILKQNKNKLRSLEGQTLDSLLLLHSNFSLTSMKPQLKNFLFRGHYRSLKVIRRSNIEFFAASALLGFLTLVWHA